MTWNYRIVAIDVQGETEYGVYEVYYDDEDKPQYRTLNPTVFVGDNKEEVLDSLIKAMLDIERYPVLTDADFPFGAGPDRPDEVWGEEWILDGGLRIRIHKRGDCKGPHCPFHNPSDHKMKDWPINWRDDRKLVERICPHGIGHPDPDDLEFKRQWYGTIYKDYAFESHGCDGCCQ